MKKVFLHGSLSLLLALIPILLIAAVLFCTVPPSANETHRPSFSEPAPLPDLPIAAIRDPNARPPEAPAPMPPNGSSPLPVIKHEYSGSLPASAEVGDDWFDDVLFIGDSRTVGLASYSGVTNATYYGKMALNIKTAFTDRFLIDARQKDCTILEAIKENPKFQKVYLWFGLNELGWTRSAFLTMYRKLIEDIRTLLPDAQIYVQSIIPVSVKVSSTSRIGVTNENIYSYNLAIAAMAESLGVYFVNTAALFADEDGALRDGVATDGVHLSPDSVKVLFVYLRTHTAATV